MDPISAQRSVYAHSDSIHLAGNCNDQRQRLVKLRIEQHGPRTYLRGNTFPLRSALHAAHAHYDRERRAWWFSSVNQARAFVKKQTGSSESAARIPAHEIEHDHIIGRAVYHARDYYLIEQGMSERGRWVRLLFPDGSKSFVTSATHVTVIRRYDPPRSLSQLHDVKLAASRGRCSCGCHREPNAGGIGSILYNGCNRCGCIA